MTTGKTTKPAPASVPFRAADFIRDEQELAVYLQELLADGDARMIPSALRTVADVTGGMAALAEKTKLSRETLYRTLSEKGNPRLDTLAAILSAFGLQLSVAPMRKAKKSRPRAKAA